MHSSALNREGELREQLANPGSPGKMAVEMECMCMERCWCWLCCTVLLF